MFKKWFEKRIYLDYAAATPLREEVEKAMKPFWSENYGNAGGIHQEGVKARAAVENARELVARTLRVRTKDVIFTSGGTEANNLAIAGSVKSMLAANVPVSEIEIISTKIEHPSVLECLKDLEKLGVRVTYTPIDEEGKVVFEEFKNNLSHRTRLVTIGYVNSETGVVQDLGRLTRVVHQYEKDNGLTIPFHTDAAQAPRWLSCALDSLGVDMVSLDAAKCEGPKGIGVLVKRQRAQIAAVLHGGAQENHLRPGTEPVALVVGAATAISLAQTEYEKVAKKVTELRDRFVKELEKLPKVVLNGSRTDRLPNNVNISIRGFDTEFAVITLDVAGIAASTKSACSASGSGRSHVIYTMTGDEQRSSSTIRFTLTPETTWGDLKKTIAVLRNHIESIQRLHSTPAPINS